MTINLEACELDTNNELFQWMQYIDYFNDWGNLDIIDEAEISIQSFNIMGELPENNIDCKQLPAKKRLRRGRGEESQKKDPNDHFIYLTKPCFKFLSHLAGEVFKKKCTSIILNQIAQIVEKTNPKVTKRTRMEKRRKKVMLSWFHRNWEQISKMKDKIYDELSTL
ncbi:hypothetical protein TRFO_21525 [Tritrichomonas foetus]|uniref:Uncharacterized protein n=1 Tax=Tritrichomonas foetus TaxID=1144522 RepID=A0A1J4KIB0_9EUKA|nr:hypothetical protein TRFO_21525 [Tritrichomonas foetus]|eukprot:OHT09564.1 hypothetical protein TRFO_21525 [Tritrichomonas foetus]